MKENISALFARHETIIAFLVCCCLALVALGANPFAGETVAPFDLLLSYPGWSSMHAAPALVRTQPSDILDSLLPTWVTLKEQILSGKGALWYPYGSGGVPISLELGNPAFWLFVLIKNNALALYCVGLAKLVVAGFGAFLLARIFLGLLPSIWCGAVYMLCGFNTAWFFWDQVTTSMWIPWLLWASVRYLTTRNIRWLPVMTAASFLLIMGGFPAVAAFGFYAFALVVLIWIVFDLFSLPERRKWLVVRRSTLVQAGLPFLAVGIAFLLSAFILVPFVDNMGQFNLGYRTNTGSSFSGFRDLLLFFAWETPLKVERTAYLGAPAVLLAIIGTVRIFRSRDAGMRRLAAAMAMLAVLGVAVLFGFVPENIVRTMPVFSTNHWSRMIVIPLLGLTVLSSIGLDILAARLRDLASRIGVAPALAGLAAAAVIIAILAAQFVLQKRAFNAYNAVVPSSWFYPATPSISFVKGRLKPLESVIADNSFMVSGTLGAYGIPEWYAHAYRTDREKEVLGRLVNDPFASPTAAFFDGGDIRFDSPLMDTLAVKYLLVHRTSFERKRVLSMPEGPRTPAPPLPANTWRQIISVPDDALVGALGFCFETYGREHAPANVRLTLYNDRGQKYGTEPELDKNEISPGAWSYFEFPERVLLKKGSYTVVLSLVDHQGQDRLSVLSTGGVGSGRNYLEVNGQQTDSSLDFKIGIVEKADMAAIGKRWNIANLEKDILVLENRQVRGGAYFIDTLDENRGRPDFDAVTAERPSAERIVIDYGGRQAGWIVLPVHLHAGWKAFVNNGPASYDAYLGMLPAIPVPGPARIVYTYEPDSLARGRVLTLAGFVMFILFTVLCLKRGRNAILSPQRGDAVGKATPDR